MGLTAGLVPPRVDAGVKAGLLDLVTHALGEGGWSLRRAAAVLGLDHVRVLRWQTRAALDQLDDRPPGPDVPLHALLDHERAAIVKLSGEWGEIDRSRTASWPTAGPASRWCTSVSPPCCGYSPPRASCCPPVSGGKPRPAQPWPDWAELVPGVIWIYDFTHFQTSRACRGRGPGRGVTVVAVHRGLRPGVLNSG